MRGERKRTDRSPGVSLETAAEGRAGGTQIEKLGRPVILFQKPTSKPLERLNCGLMRKGRADRTCRQIGLDPSDREEGELERENVRCLASRRSQLDQQIREKRTGARCADCMPRMRDTYHGLVSLPSPGDSTASNAVATRTISFADKSFSWKFCKGTCRARA